MSRSSPQDRFTAEVLLRLRPATLAEWLEPALAPKPRWASAASALLGAGIRVESSTDPPSSRVDLLIDTRDPGVSGAVEHAVDRARRLATLAGYAVTPFPHADARRLRHWPDAGIVAVAWPDHAGSGAVLASATDPAGLGHPGIASEWTPPPLEPLGTMREALGRAQADLAEREYALALFRGSIPHRVARRLRSVRWAHAINARGRTPTLEARVDGRVRFRSVHARSVDPPFPWDFVGRSGAWRMEDSPEGLCGVCSGGSLWLRGEDPELRVFAEPGAGLVTCRIGSVTRVARLESPVRRAAVIRPLWADA